MKTYILIISLVLFFTGCKDGPREKGGPSERHAVFGQNPGADLALDCYTYIKAKDTVQLQITDLGEGVIATLTYALDGKDRNTGILQGAVEGDKIFGEYTFMSEGVLSTREVSFLIQDDRLIEGHGPLNGEGTAFVDRDQLVYTPNMPLTKTVCPH